LTDAVVPPISQSRTPVAALIVGTILATAAAVALGVGIGDAWRLGTVLAALVLGLIALLFVFARTFAGYLVLISSSVMLIVFPGIGPLGANAFDGLLWPVLAGSYWGLAREKAQQGDAAEVGGAHDEIRAAHRRFSRAILLFFGVAALSLVMAAAQGRVGQLFASGLKLLRVFQGALLFPLGVMLLRTPRRMHLAIGAALVGGAVFAIVNSLAFGVSGVARAGITWWPLEPGISTADPNTAGTAMVLLWVLVLARQATRPQVLNLVMLPVVLTMLLLTQSRSGLLAWLTFTILSLRHLKWWHVVLGGLVLWALIPLVPEHYWIRMTRTVEMEPGSIDAFSSLVRLYAWKLAWQMFLDHPIFGVGYLGFGFMSNGYGSVGVYCGTVDNLYLEMATSVGLVGLGVLGFAVFRMFQLGATIRRVAPPGTLGFHLGWLHGPFIASLLVANFTGMPLLGIVGAAQLAFWNALLVRAGHEAVETARRDRATDASSGPAFLIPGLA